MTVEQIRERMVAAGSHWWDRDSMRFFGTRVSGDTYEAKGSVWFVTSEQPPYGRRMYSVRRYDMAGNDIHTEGDFASYKSRSGALAAARRLAGGNAAIASGQLTPVTALDQMYRDLCQHGCRSVTITRCKAIRRYVNWHQQIMTDYCNGEYEAYGDQGEPRPRLARCCKLLTEQCQAIGCGVVFQGDPRGATAKLVLPDGFTNDWGKEGYCLPQ